MAIIRGRAIVEDDYVHVPDGAEVPTGARPIVSLGRWVAQRDELLARHAAVGVQLPADKLPGDVPVLDRLALIAIEFVRFTEGRGYSVARLLRERHGFRGELRAVGYVLREQLRYLERCGFDAYELHPGKSLEAALDGFTELDLTYQADATERRPIYRRR